MIDRTKPLISMMIHRMKTAPEYKQTVDELDDFDVNETAKKGADAGYSKVLNWSLAADIYVTGSELQELQNLHDVYPRER